MFDPEDYDPPACYTERRRRARKPHHCYECRGTIQPGDHYRHCSGVWDGQPNAYRLCSACAALADKVQDAGRLFLFGELHEAYQQVLGDAVDSLAES